jgi:hypothetical protein
MSSILPEGWLLGSVSALPLIHDNGSLINPLYQLFLTTGKSIRLQGQKTLDLSIFLKA